MGQITDKDRRLSCHHTVLNNGVTGSCHILDFRFSNDEHHLFLADVGMFLRGEAEDLQKRENGYLVNNLSFPIEMCDIEGIMISHNHTDHIGRLPLLVHLGYKGPIYVTYATALLIKDALMDCYKCTRRTLQLYNEIDVERTLNLLRIVDFNKTIRVYNNGSNGRKSVDVTFFMNGHLLGSACMLFHAKEEKEDLNIFYTGDYKKENIFFDAKPIPQWVYKLPMNLIVESTYGTSDSADIEYTFQKNVIRATRRGGTVIIPVIALERTEVVLYNLKQMQRDEILDTNIPIFLVGKLAVQYLHVYHQKNSLVKSRLGLINDAINFIPKNFSVVSGENIDDILWSRKQMIVLATPGMMTQGNSYNFIMKHIENKKDLIQITSYVASEFGNKILNAERGEQLTFTNNHRAMVKAEVEQTNEFSAHAKRDELYNDVIRKFEKIECLTIVHGEPEVRRSFAEYVKSQKGFSKDTPVIIGDKNKKIIYSNNGPKEVYEKLENIEPLIIRIRETKRKNYKFRQRKNRNSKKR